MVSSVTIRLLLLFLEAHLTQVTDADLQVYFYRYPPGQYWQVEGLATWINTNSVSQSLDCNTTSNSGDGVGWSRQAGLKLSRVQAVTNGKRLVLDSLGSTDFGIYTCFDGATNESLTINVTSANPAIQAVSDVVTIEAGSSGQLKVYISGVPNPTSTDISWFKVGPGGIKTELKEPTVNFSSDHRTLLLTNVQESNGGTYNCVVTTSGTTAFSTIHLDVSSKPALQGNAPGYSHYGNTSLCVENSTFSSVDDQGQVTMPATEFILVAVIVLLAALLAIVSLSFAFYCCYVHQQLGKAKTYSMNSPNNLEKYNVEPYLTAAGQDCVVVDPVYSNIK
ncbi:hypothetical protein EMCRGX_G019853 [Ephydatia muelleri]